jgi:hypothetical protein
VGQKPRHKERGRSQNEPLHNFLHNPRRSRLTRGIISNSSTRRGELAATLQWETSLFLAEFAQVADRKTVASWQKRFEQVLISRTLSDCGEVAERLKAAVC